MSTFLDLPALSAALIAGCTTGIEAGAVIALTVVSSLVVGFCAHRFLDPSNKQNGLFDFLAVAVCLISTFFEWIFKMEDPASADVPVTKWWFLCIVTGYTRGVVILVFVTAVVWSVAKLLDQFEGKKPERVEK